MWGGLEAGRSLSDVERLRRFEGLVVPCLPSAYNLARWLTRNEHDAEDIVQEASLLAFRGFDRFRGGDPRAWLLAIVRNAAYSFLRRRRGGEAASLDLSCEGLHEPADEALDPEERLVREADERLVQEALVELPAEFREVIVLREMEGLSYKEIAEVADVPIGTVMSRLARARHRLHAALAARLKESAR
jgi:RNA polymerase sigma-70 factor (ECF subfamily)